MTSCCQNSTSCHQKADNAQTTIALVGNPNCGKTTLFNALTGSRQRVGNWPGVTVERKTGTFSAAGSTVQVIDLPGLYSLTQTSAAIDERIAADYITEQQADLIVNIVDASHLERHLYLTLQLLEMGLPVILALNMMDVAAAKNIHIDTAKLSHDLGCPVVVLEANKGGGITELKRVVLSAALSLRSASRPSPSHDTQNSELGAAITSLTSLGLSSWQAIRLLEDDHALQQTTSPDLLKAVSAQQIKIREATGEDADILLADARYQAISQLIAHCLSRSPVTKTDWTARLDQVILNRVLGIPIFLAMMYFLFFFAINIGGAFQDFFDISSQTIFVDGLGQALTWLHFPTWLTALLANGIGKGINTTITFVPVIGSMFLFLALLEDSGYMARAAFVVDRFMRALGLPGKAFVPMIVGFGCNVPAVMGARTLENKRDRILTIMMTPFMSCGARLAIFAVFTAAFFPRGGQNVVFALYLIGIGMAVLTGYLLRLTVLKGEVSPLVMELPPYHMPRMKTLLLHAWQRLKGFVFRAGKLIVPICVLIGALNSLNLDGTINTGEGDAHSLLSLVGQWVTPIFAPMGIHVDNWPATVGLVTGVLAKEVVVGTLNTLYTQVGHFAQTGGDAVQFWGHLKEAVLSIPNNFVELGSAFSNPVLAKAPVHAINQGVYGLMYQRFDGQAGAFAYLLFVLLYFPCVSTMAVMLRELHRGWTIFSALWMTGVAYATAVVFYQAATWLRHPESSSIWIAAMLISFIGTIILVRIGVREEVQYEPA